MSRVVPDAKLDETALEIARQIAAAPAFTVQMFRRTLGRLANPAVTTSLAEEALTQSLVFASRDYAELKAARAEKRGHFGCAGIRERGRKIGADVTWHSVPQQGTTVQVVLPLKSTIHSTSKTPKPGLSSAAADEPMLRKQFHATPEARQSQPG